MCEKAKQNVFLETHSSLRKEALLQEPLQMKIIRSNCWILKNYWPLVRVEHQAATKKCSTVIKKRLANNYQIPSFFNVVLCSHLIMVFRVRR